jgi:hypothetical protein
MKGKNYMPGLLKVLHLILTMFARSATASQEAPQKKDNLVPPTPSPRPKPLFKNDSGRLKDELEALMTKNPELYDLVYDVCGYAKTEFNKSVVITMIYRTQEEQDMIYKDDPKYKVKKFTSPHQYWDAFDLRSSNFDTTEIEKLVNYVNTKYNFKNIYKWTSKNHDIGLGFHYHTQFRKK